MKFGSAPFPAACGPGQMATLGLPLLARDKSVTLPVVLGTTIDAVVDGFVMGYDGYQTRRYLLIKHEDHDCLVPFSAVSNVSGVQRADISLPESCGAVFSGRTPSAIANAYAVFGAASQRPQWLVLARGGDRRGSCR